VKPKDKQHQISDELALIMLRHDFDLKGLTDFISENHQPVIAAWTKKLRHRDYLAHRKVVRREVLRLRWEGVPHKKIHEILDVPLSRITEIKAEEMDNIWKAYTRNPESVHDLAEEYQLTANDIFAIYQDRQERWEAQEAEYWERQQERWDEEEELYNG
jgi:hypothetical protein